MIPGRVPALVRALIPLLCLSCAIAINDTVALTEFVHEPCPVAPPRPKVPQDAARLLFIGAHHTGTSSYISMIRRIGIQSQDAPPLLRFPAHDFSWTFDKRKIWLHDALADTTFRRPQEWNSSFEFGHFRHPNVRMLATCFPSAKFVINTRPLREYVVTCTPLTNDFGFVLQRKILKLLCECLRLRASIVCGAQVRAVQAGVGGRARQDGRAKRTVRRPLGHRKGCPGRRRRRRRRLARIPLPRCGAGDGRGGCCGGRGGGQPLVGGIVALCIPGLVACDGEVPRGRVRRGPGPGAAAPSVSATRLSPAPPTPVTPRL